MKASLIFGGDIVPTFKNLDYFCEGQIDKILEEELKDFLLNADFRLYNLETPLTDIFSPIQKDGRNFAVPTKAVNGIKKLLPTVISLANNHCLDQGEKGLHDTISTLEAEKIKVVGAKTEREVKEPLFVNVNGYNVAIVCCAEKEFNVSSKGYGAVIYDRYWTNKSIETAKEKSDFVVVIYHGGKEYYEYASPLLRERCRLMVDCGADLVLCQHSHCVSCYEKYKESTIVYGQGNFIFHQTNEKTITKEGLLVSVAISDGKKNVEFHPIRLNFDDQVVLLKGDEKETKLGELNERSRCLANSDEVNKHYRELSKKNRDGYFSIIEHQNGCFKIARKINKLLGKAQLTKKQMLKLLNCLQNDSHRELFIEILLHEIEEGDYE